MVSRFSCLVYSILASLSQGIGMQFVEDGWVNQIQAIIVASGSIVIRGLVDASVLERISSFVRRILLQPSLNG